MKLIYYKDSEWHMCTEKVRYMQHGKEIEQYVGNEGHDWWVEFANKWEHTEIIEFMPVTSTAERLERLEEIKYIGEGYGSLCTEYVERGTLPDSVNNPLWQLKVIKESEQQGVEISEREIQEIIMNRQISALEIKILELGGK